MLADSPQQVSSNINGLKKITNRVLRESGISVFVIGFHSFKGGGGDFLFSVTRLLPANWLFPPD